MQLLLLHLDDALELQPEFVRSCLMAGAHELHEKECGQSVRLWGRQTALDGLWRKLQQAKGRSSSGPRLTFMGSGDFHHITSLLLNLAVEDTTDKVTVVHIDNHPDWVNFDDGMHCGSWVNRALENPSVDKVITLGVCSSDLRSPERKGANLSILGNGRLELYPYAHAPSRVKAHYGTGRSYEQRSGALHWQTISEIGEMNFLDRLLSSIKTHSVYLTIDKDVLARTDAVTNWDQGCMRLTYVLQIISEIAQCHRIVGADVTGDYSQPLYSGNLWTRTLKRAEIMIDQPSCSLGGDAIRNINSAANFALLDVLAEHMP